MVSLTGKTTTRREIRAKSAGRIARAQRAKAGTPAFPVHPEGYDPKAADAKPQSDDGSQSVQAQSNNSQQSK